MDRKKFVQHLARQLNQHLVISLSDLCKPRAHIHTVPIFKSDERKALNFGSGVLLKLDGQGCLVTAGHVLDDILLEPQAMGIPGLHHGMKGLKLLFDGYCTNAIPEAGRGNDMIDAGALKLDKDLSDHVNNRYVTEGMCEQNDNELVGNQYMIYGFPGGSGWRRWTRPTAVAKAYSQVTSIYRGETGLLEAYDPKRELLLNYSMRRNISRSGQIVTAPKPKGLSGCGIWRLITADKPISSWTIGNMKLVGIVHSRIRQLEVVRVTRISYILNMIRSQGWQQVPSPEPEG
ncbi:MAG: hypothetical protein P4L85_01405 [Paludisphaera borealis]|uniref:hypothetical protein n=1 Tax=Paludisphaera borealis TaxID=1387353 RepID=UPI002843313E|nr:hypothetical protein [Paludisphaera borealis]MDR3617976.1 hypothetical protein [Paludisphaera borealis]